MKAFMIEDDPIKWATPERNKAGRAIVREQIRRKDLGVAWALTLLYACY